MYMAKAVGDVKSTVGLRGPWRYRPGAQERVGWTEERDSSAGERREKRVRRYPSSTRPV